MQSQNTQPVQAIFRLALLAMMIAGCAPAKPAPTVPTLPQTALPSAFATATAAPATPSMTVASRCIPIEDTASDNLPLTGIWVRNEAIPYLEDIATSADKRIPLNGGGIFSTSRGDMAVSPDGKHIAYIDQYFDAVVKYQPTRRVLRVIDSTGHSLQMDFWKEDWQYIIGWVDDQQIALFTSSEQIVVLNPFSGDWEPFAEPAWLIAKGFTGDKYRFDDWQAPTFTPRLNTVIIPSESGGDDLRDMQSGAVLFHGLSDGGYWTPDWSADPSNWALIAQGDIVTFLQNNHPVAEFDAQAIVPDIDFLYDLKLSPDGQKVAFSAPEPHAYRTQLLVYDRTKRAADVICSDKFEFDWSHIAWSPDSRFLVGEIYDRTYQDFDVLVDTQQGRAFKLISGRFQHRILWLPNP